ncbi:DNA-processing protein DprA [Microbacterium karelineae]|uniref:DNA-processing protein DprA n=1 Tax=Microbacterium karelineae TaxID=2654283 RepID=UPI0012EA7A3C|nr:DNA-processing protein DprA [Microbacterium karelineae]
MSRPPLIAPAALDAARAWLGEERQPERVARVAWSVLIEPGDRVAGERIARLGAAGALDGLAEAARGGDRELAQAVDRWRSRWDPALVTAAIAEGARREMRLLVPGDAAWPEAFDVLGPHAPVALWVRGDPAALVGAATIGMVGARAATPYGEHVAADIAGDLAAGGATIVSGAAYGIDGAAHRAALSAGGRTVAFVAGGADRVYPAGHANLFAQIAETGAVIAECPPGTTPTRWRFLARNRLIAAVSDATIVVEAGARSGSINTASHAASLGRPLGAVPGPVTSSTSAGCHRVLREYDAVCVTSADDVRELIGAAGEPSLPAYESAEAVRVADALSRRVPRDVDAIARRSGLAPADVIATLGLLGLQGTAEAQPDGWVSTV